MSTLKLALILSFAVSYQALERILEDTDRSHGEKNTHDRHLPRSYEKRDWERRGPPRENSENPVEKESLRSRWRSIEEQWNSAERIQKDKDTERPTENRKLPNRSHAERSGGRRGEARRGPDSPSDTVNSRRRLVNREDIDESRAEHIRKKHVQKKPPDHIQHYIWSNEEGDGGMLRDSRRISVSEGSRRRWRPIEDSGEGEEYDRKRSKKHGKRDKDDRKSTVWSYEEKDSGRRKDGLRGSMRRPQRDDSQEKWWPREDYEESEEKREKGFFDVVLHVLDTFLKSSRDRLRKAREREAKEKKAEAKEAANQATPKILNARGKALLASKTAGKPEKSAIVPAAAPKSAKVLLGELLSKISNATGEKTTEKGENVPEKAEPADEKHAKVADEIGPACANDEVGRSSEKLRSVNVGDEGKKKGKKMGGKSNELSRAASKEEGGGGKSREAMLMNVGQKSAELATDVLNHMSTKIGTAVTNYLNRPASAD